MIDRVIDRSVIRIFNSLTLLFSRNLHKFYSMAFCSFFFIINAIFIEMYFVAYFELEPVDCQEKTHFILQLWRQQKNDIIDLQLIGQKDFSRSIQSKNVVEMSGKKLVQCRIRTRVSKNKLQSFAQMKCQNTSSAKMMMKLKNCRKKQKFGQHKQEVHRNSHLIYHEQF